MTLLLMAGTAEARALAGQLAAQGVDTIASLAGVTQAPLSYPVPLRSGGFGGAKAQKRFMIETSIRAVIDATHPFAQQIPSRTCQISTELGLPYLRLMRPVWQAGEGDDWRDIATPSQAAKTIPTGARVLLATGAKSVGDWAELAAGRTLFCRRVDETPEGFPYNGGWIVGRPPFSFEEERALLAERQIDWIVTKNAGGVADAKLVAARALGLPVVMLSRPKPQACDHAETLEEALEWLASQNL